VNAPAGEVRRQRNGGVLHPLHHAHAPEAAQIVPHHAVLKIRQHGGVRHVQLSRQLQVVQRLRHAPPAGAVQPFGVVAGRHPVWDVIPLAHLDVYLLSRLVNRHAVPLRQEKRQHPPNPIGSRPGAEVRPPIRRDRPRRCPRARPSSVLVRGLPVVVRRRVHRVPVLRLGGLRVREVLSCP